MDRRRTLVSSWCYRLKRRVVDRSRPGCERAGVSASVTAAVHEAGQSTTTPPVRGALRTNAGHNLPGARIVPFRMESGSRS